MHPGAAKFQALGKLRVRSGSSSKQLIWSLATAIVTCHSDSISVFTSRKDDGCSKERCSSGLNLKPWNDILVAVSVHKVRMYLRPSPFVILSVYWYWYISHQQNILDETIWIRTNTPICCTSAFRVLLPSGVCIVCDSATHSRAHKYCWSDMRSLYFLM